MARGVKKAATERTIDRSRSRRSDAEPEFDVALSFAGEDREYVERTANILHQMGFRVFYDKYEQVTLWGRDLYEHLSDVYSKKARFTVMFISRNYAKKLWTNHERKSAQSRAFSERREYILPVRFDATEIPALLPTVGYISVRDLQPDQLAELIKKKIGRVNRERFFPQLPDRLFKAIGAKTPAARDLARKVAGWFFRQLRLMTADEKKILALAAKHTCPNGPKFENNVHLNIHLLERVTGLDKMTILAALSRLDCLQVHHRMTTHDRKRAPKDVLQITYEPMFLAGDEDILGNYSTVIHAMFACMAESYCDEHFLEAIKKLDFSALSSLAAIPDAHDESKAGAQGPAHRDVGRKSRIPGRRH